MELLDTYDEDGNFLGTVDRDIVHRDALWHNTVHCWLYDEDGNVYFQIREDTKTFYTTASGHVQAGESIKEAFGREISEEIGIQVNYESAEFVTINKFVMDKIKKDGSLFRDRAFANVYVCQFNGDKSEFRFDTNEVLGLSKVNAKDALKLFRNEIDSIEISTIIKDEDGNVETKSIAAREDFLLNQGETLIEKYGLILEKVLELTNGSNI